MINHVEVEQHAIRQSCGMDSPHLKHLREDKQVFWFLLAFFCYIDGVYTIIDMATAYGTALGRRPTYLACLAGNADRGLPFGADLWSAAQNIRPASLSRSASRPTPAWRRLPSS